MVFSIHVSITEVRKFEKQLDAKRMYAREYLRSFLDRKFTFKNCKSSNWIRNKWTILHLNPLIDSGAEKHERISGINLLTIDKLALKPFCFRGHRHGGGDLLFIAFACICLFLRESGRPLPRLKKGVINQVPGNGLSWFWIKKIKGVLPFSGMFESSQ